MADCLSFNGKIKSNQVTPRQLFKIVVYAAMNHIYSCRQIESACRRDINFMYLLEGKPAPDHATIARFLSLHFSQCSQNTLAAQSVILAIAHNINKLHHKIQNGKTGQHLFGLKKST